MRPAQPVAQHTKSALPRPLGGPSPAVGRPYSGSRQPRLAIHRVSTKVDTYRAMPRIHPFPGNAWRSSSTSTRWFSE